VAEEIERPVLFQTYVDELANLSVSCEVNATIDTRRFTFGTSEPCSLCIKKLFCKDAYRRAATRGACALRGHSLRLAQSDETTPAARNADASG
jgi:hypothetical protein